MPHVDFELTLAGKKLDPQYKFDSVRLEMSLETHHQARVRMASTAAGERGSERSDLLDQAFDALGEKARLEMKPAQGQGLVFEGLVAAANHERALDGDHTVVLTITSPTILLDAGVRCRIWEDESLKAVAESVLNDLDAVPAKLDQLPSTKLPYEAQFEETDYNFLRRLAGRSSVWLYYDGVQFRTEKSLPESGLSFTLSVLRGADIGRLEELSVESRILPGAFAESHFLAKEKDFIAADQSESASTQTAHPFVDLARNGSDNLYKAAVHPRPLAEVLSEKQLKEFARARGESWFRALVVATGTTGHTGIRPGANVTIQGTGGGEDADYLVVATVHEFNRPGGYSCRLTMVPAAVAFPPVSAPAPVTPLSRAIVLGDYSDEHPGMIRVQYSRQVEDAGGEGGAQTTWARVATSHGGESAGFVAVPEIGDEVIVGHIAGRATHPVILGSVYSEEKKSPVFDEISGTIPDNEGKAFLTKSGNLILLTDTAGSETIELRSPDGQNLLRMTLDGPKVELETEGDVFVKAQKTISIESQGDMILDSQGKLSLSAKGNLSLETQGSLSADAMKNIALSAKQSLTGKGTKEVTLEGTQFKAQGTAQAELSGAQTGVKGQAMVQVQAPLVKIN